jgi:hypothetical protein
MELAIITYLIGVATGFAFCHAGSKRKPKIIVDKYAIRPGCAPNLMIGDCIAQCLNCLDNEYEGYTCTCDNPRWCMSYSDIQQKKQELKLR